MKISKLSDIAYLRLVQHQVWMSKMNSVKELVGWMGAMQAQDFLMAKWAIGARLPGFTENMVELSIDQGEIIRTHLMRPTWHFVSSDDIYWMLDLTAPNIRASMKTRDQELGLTENVYNRTNSLIINALNGGKSLSREDILKELEAASIPTNENRASHILMRAELDGVICSGPSKGQKRTYALLEERVPKLNSFSREEALANLARRYFTSHCPATLQDFIWWSGLSVRDSKNALQMIKPEFIQEVINDQTYWFTNSFTMPESDGNMVHILPAYDEYIISYKDRTPSLIYENSKKVVSNNGIFRPVIVLNGQVIGVWKRNTVKNKIVIETTLFDSFNDEIMVGIKTAFTGFETFLDKKIHLVLH